MFKFIFYIVFLSFLLVESVFATEVCFSHTNKAKVVIGIDMENKPSDSLLRTFDNFFHSAKKNNAQKITDFYSVLDGSKNSIKKSIMKSKDMFSNYKNITNYEVNDKVFRWGGYHIFNVTYDYKGKKINLAESVFCNKKECQISNIFEDTKRDDNIDLVSRIMFELKKGRLASRDCNDVKKGFDEIEIFPKASFDKVKPISVYFDRNNLKIKKEKKSSLQKEFSHKNNKCEKLLVSVVKEASLNKDLVNKILASCSINTKYNSLTPVAFLSKKKVLLKYLTMSSFISTLLSTKEDIRVIKIEENVYIASLNSGHNKSMLILPFIERDKVFDWSFFGGYLGDLLSNKEVIQYFFNKLGDDNA